MRFRSAGASTIRSEKIEWFGVEQLDWFAELEMRHARFLCELVASGLVSHSISTAGQSWSERADLGPIGTDTASLHDFQQTLNPIS